MENSSKKKNNLIMMKWYNKKLTIKVYNILK